MLVLTETRYVVKISTIFLHTFLLAFNLISPFFFGLNSSNLFGVGKVNSLPIRRYLEFPGFCLKQAFLLGKLIWEKYY